MKSADATLVIANVMEQFGVKPSQWGFIQKPSRVTYLGRDRRGLPHRYEVRVKRSWSADTLANYLLKCLYAIMRSEELPPAPTRAARKAQTAEKKARKQLAAKAQKAKTAKPARQSDLLTTNHPGEPPA
ncbi:hypothetical protein [Hyphomicrobium sp.]|uniref:hypothetical protein n=1 Tax=Hyphomicrobium sp. TaxID=82 RepID=UPI001DADC197|nr:hypothetical protein [Hyphomicrobium sp.]MBY0562447.1 hypothetical protein [Hyphomicrobium sp.]